MARRGRKGNTMTDQYDETEQVEQFEGEKQPEPDGTYITFEDALLFHGKADSFAGRALELANDPEKLEEAVNAYRVRLQNKAQIGAEEVRQWKANIAAAATGDPAPYPKAKRRGRGQGDSAE